MSPTTTSDRAPRRGLPQRRTAKGQEGFTLASLIVIFTILAIIVAYTVPEQWSLVMKRERDRQTIFVMRQYARSIMEFQKKHQSPPTSLEQLKEARRPRMIRNDGGWVCPLTQEVDWILVPQQAVTVAGAPGNQNAPGPGFVPNQGRLTNPQWNTPSGRNPASNPQQPVAPVGGAAMAWAKLNPELSPADYKGPFVSVRPRVKGKSMIALNGVEEYGEWVFTAQDMTNEIAMRNQALAVK